MITPMISSSLSFLQKVSFLLLVHSWHSKRTTLERTKFQREGRTVEAKTSFESKRRRKRGTIEFYNAKFPLARRFLFPRDRPTERAVGSFVSFQTQAAFIDSFRDNKTWMWVTIQLWQWSGTCWYRRRNWLKLRMGGSTALINKANSRSTILFLGRESINSWFLDYRVI